MIKILIVDDSKVISMLLQAIIDVESDMEIIGIATDGLQAVEMCKRLKPDIITMDIRMPIMNGFEATERIMSENPTPIIVISASVNSDDLKIAFNAIEAGALTVMEKPPGLRSETFESIRRELVSNIRAFSEMKLVRRRVFRPLKPLSMTTLDKHLNAANEIVVLGASTGGPSVIHQILSSLPADFPLPIVVIQHMATGFIEGYAQWLNTDSHAEVKIAENNEILKGGTVYIPKNGMHLQVARLGKQLQLKLIDGEPVNNFTPAIDCLFKSVAAVCPGHAIGGLMTGMGQDGAKGLLEMKNNHCLTFIQDEASSIVWGMPGTAHALEAQCETLTPTAMPDFLIKHIHSVFDARKRKRP